MKKILKEKILIDSEKIQELLDCINSIKNNKESKMDIIKNLEKKCYDIIAKKCIVRWCQRLRIKTLNNIKIKKKGTIFKIKN